MAIDNSPARKLHLVRGFPSRSTGTISIIRKTVTFNLLFKHMRISCWRREKSSWNWQWPWKAARVVQGLISRDQPNRGEKGGIWLQTAQIDDDMAHGFAAWIWIWISLCEFQEYSEAFVWKWPLEPEWIVDFDQNISKPCGSRSDKTNCFDVAIAESAW